MKFIPLQCIVIGKKTPKVPRFTSEFATLPEKDRATAIVNMHQTIGKDHGCGYEDILADRQTDTQALLITILRNRSSSASK